MRARIVSDMPDVATDDSRVAPAVSLYEVTVGDTVIAPLPPKAPGYACGPDCRWACGYAVDAWAPWIRCTHSAVGGVFTEGRECPWFTPGGVITPVSEQESESPASVPAL